MPRPIRRSIAYLGFAHPGRVAILIACVTVLARCWLLLHNYTPEKILQPDSSGYERPAISFLENGRFVEAHEIQDFFAMLDGSAPSTEPRPMFIRTPGYPLFIAAAYRLGANRRGLVILQIVFSGLAVWLTYVLGKELFFAWAGVLAALLIAIDPATVWCSQLILSETLFGVLLIAGVIAGIKLLRGPTLPLAVSLGAIVGIATLVKPVAYYLPIPMFAVLIWGRVPKSFLAGALVPLLVLLGGWQVRNLRTVGTSAFSGAQNLNVLLWYAAGIIAQQQGIDFESAQKQAIRMIPKAPQLPAAELNREFFRVGAGVVRAYPIPWLRDMAKGMVVNLISPGARSFPQYFGLPAIPFIAGYVLFLSLFYMAALIQGAVTWGRGDAAIYALAAVVAVYLVAIQAGAGSTCRYRVPAMPFFAVYAAGGMLSMFQRRVAEPELADDESRER